LAGSSDLLSAAEAAALTTGARAVEQDTLRQTFAERGYLSDEASEQRRYRAAYLAAMQTRDEDEVQLFFAPTYACNFDCAYCYQTEYAHDGGYARTEVIAAFYAYVEQSFAGRKKYVTLFGGEPLLTSASAQAGLAALVDGAAARHLDLAVVTNGYNLCEALPVLTRAHLREIQVTIDGLAALHDARRPLKGGGSTFARVVAGVDETLARNLAVNLRVVVDRDNLAGLPELARFAIARGWTTSPHFKTQLGRNYELHTCQAQASRLYSRLELHEALLDLARAHPEVLELHRPAFSVTRYLAEHGKLPAPLFDSCPGCKSEWAFDASGRIYACTATVGKADESLGTFFPAVRLQEEKVAKWQDRDVLAIAECKNCPVQLACGGGCAAVAKHKTGRLHGPDCRPIRELLGLGAALYLDQGVHRE